MVRPGILVTLEDGSLGLPDPPPLPKLGTFATRAEWEQAKAEHKVLMADRRDGQKWLHEQKRDRRLRDRPCEAAAKLTPEEKLAKYEENKVARTERKQDKADAARATANSRVVEFMAVQAAARACERAAFEAHCAARLQAEAERKAAETIRTSMRAPPEDRWRIAPRWWLDGGGGGRG